MAIPIKKKPRKYGVGQVDDIGREVGPAPTKAKAPTPNTPELLTYTEFHYRKRGLQIPAALRHHSPEQLNALHLYLPCLTPALYRTWPKFWHHWDINPVAVRIVATHDEAPEIARALFPKLAGQMDLKRIDRPTIPPLPRAIKPHLYEWPPRNLKLFPYTPTELSFQKRGTPIPPFMRHHPATLLDKLAAYLPLLWPKGKPPKRPAPNCLRWQIWQTPRRSGGVWTRLLEIVCKADEAPGIARQLFPALAGKMELEPVA